MLSFPATKADLAKQLADDDLRVKMFQCAFINLGGPEAVMSLISLGAQHDALNSYFRALVPQANELGNSMLQGGNYEVSQGPGAKRFAG